MGAFGEREAHMGVGLDGRGVVLYDVVGLLPQHKTKRYGKRALKELRYQVVHHSGALRKGDTFRHMVSSARYVVDKRGFPGFAYTTWIPYWDTFDENGDRVVYRGNLDTTRCWHGGRGPNRKAISHALQGNLSQRPMSRHQLNVTPVVLRWFQSELALFRAPEGHFQVGADGHPKKSCPGEAGKAWLLGYQAGLGSA